MFSLPTRHSYNAAAFSNMPLSTKWTERQTHLLIVLLSRLGVPCPPACLRGCSPPSPLLLFLPFSSSPLPLLLPPFLLSLSNISLKTRYCPLLLLLVPESGTRDPG